MVAEQEALEVVAAALAAHGHEHAVRVGAFLEAAPARAAAPKAQHLPRAKARRANVVVARLAAEKIEAWVEIYHRLRQGRRALPGRLR